MYSELFLFTNLVALQPVPGDCHRQNTMWSTCVVKPLQIGSNAVCLFVRLNDTKLSKTQIGVEETRQSPTQLKVWR